MADPKVLENYINGKFVPCKGSRIIDCMNPATDEVVCRVAMSTKEEVEECIK